MKGPVGDLKTNIDHKVPVNRWLLGLNGMNDEPNLCLAHAFCNRIKSTRTLEERYKIGLGVTL